jgi:Flp pilus assembly protein CpaB
MEIEYQDSSRRGKYLVAIGIVLALIAGGGAFFIITQAQQQAGQAGLQTAAIVVAARDIPGRKVLAAEDLEVRELPTNDTTAQGVFAEPSKLVGLVAGTTILKGQPVYANMLAGETKGSQFSILTPGETISPDSPAWRAVSITVPDDRAVAGLLQAGASVDVFVTSTVTVPADVAAEGRYFTDKSTKIVYQDMLILAKTATAYVLKASIPVAEEISHLQASGAAAFSFALRPGQDLREVDTSTLGTTTTKIVARYGLPLPEWYGPGKAPAPSPFPSSSPGASPAVPESPSPAPSPVP